MDFIPKKRCSDIRGCHDFYIYQIQNRHISCVSLVFVSSFIVSLILTLAYVLNFHPNDIFLTSSVLSIVLCLYGFIVYSYGFSRLKKLQMNSKMNTEYIETRLSSKEYQDLVCEIDRFSHAKDELKDTKRRIFAAIERQKISLGKFREMNANLKATDQKNLELLDDFNKMTDKMEDKWRQDLIKKRKKERKILHVCFDRFDWEDGNDGISKEQFTKFKLTLPLEYQLRLQRAGSWSTIASDGILQLEEFIELLDKFAEDGFNDLHNFNDKQHDK